MLVKYGFTWRRCFWSSDAKSNKVFLIFSGCVLSFDLFIFLSKKYACDCQLLVTARGSFSNNVNARCYYSLADLMKHGRNRLRINSLPTKYDIKLKIKGIWLWCSDKQFNETQMSEKTKTFSWDLNISCYWNSSEPVSNQLYLWQ